jgi:hypothetical protein
MDVDLSLIFWLPPLVAAILGGSVAFPTEGRPNDGSPLTRRQRLGAWLVVGGLIVTVGGLWTWVTEVERRGQLLGTVVFLAGSTGAFIGLQLVRGPTPRWKER